MECAGRAQLPPTGGRQLVETLIRTASSTLEFTLQRGNPASYIAKWNGSSWNPLGSGMNNLVRAVAASGDNVYAGGDFTTAGGSSANYVAHWNGSSWSPLGSGINGRVDALVLVGSELYAGGRFTMAGGIAANSIAKWNGSTWTPLGSGVSGPQPYIFTLAVSGSTLYTGGFFTSAGGKASRYVARAYLEQPALSILRSDADLTVSWPTFYDTFALQQNPNAANTNTWSDANFPLTTNGATKTATVLITPTNHFFRLIGN